MVDRIDTNEKVRMGESCFDGNPYLLCLCVNMKVCVITGGPLAVLFLAWLAEVSLDCGEPVLVPLHFPHPCVFILFPYSSYS